MFTNATNKFWSYVMNSLADVDGFKSCIQVCLWLDFPSLTMKSNSDSLCLPLKNWSKQICHTGSHHRIEGENTHFTYQYLPLIKNFKLNFLFIKATDYFCERLMLSRLSPRMALFLRNFNSSAFNYYWEIYNERKTQNNFRLFQNLLKMIQKFRIISCFTFSVKNSENLRYLE